MTGLELVGVSLANKSKVDKLLSTLDNAAREYEHYEYGLPLSNESVMAQMREIVYTWLLNLKQEVENNDPS